MSRKPGRTADKGSGRRGIPQDDDGWTVVRRPGLGPVRIRVGANEPQEPPEELEGVVHCDVVCPRPAVWSRWLHISHSLPMELM